MSYHVRLLCMITTTQAVGMMSPALQAILARNGGFYLTR